PAARGSRKLLDDAHCAVVAELPAGVGPAVADDSARNFRRRQRLRLVEHAREPLRPVELAVPSRFDDTVGDYDDRAPGLEHGAILRVRLTRLDAEREPPDLKRHHAS